jgi:hypothetical protein
MTAKLVNELGNTLDRAGLPAQQTDANSEILPSPNHRFFSPDFAKKDAVGY